jgi:hypothetical protein
MDPYAYHTTRADFGLSARTGVFTKRVGYRRDLSGMMVSGLRGCLTGDLSGGAGRILYCTGDAGGLD